MSAPNYPIFEIRGSVGDSIAQTFNFNPQSVKGKSNLTMIAVIAILFLLFIKR